MEKADSELSFDQNGLFQQLGIGTMGLYLNPKELDDFMTDLDSQFPSLITKFKLGESHEGKNINALLVGLDLKTKETTMQKPAVLIAGSYSARELTSTSFANYAVLKLAYGYVNQDPSIMAILSQTAIVVVPTVNIDGFRAIGNQFLETGLLSYYKKNRHQYGQCDSKTQYGVDLKQNFFNNETNDEYCSDQYPGPNAFSEPETSAIKNLLDNWSNFKVAINLNSYGDYMSFPSDASAPANEFYKSLH